MDLTPGEAALLVSAFTFAFICTVVSCVQTCLLRRRIRRLPETMRMPLHYSEA